MHGKKKLLAVISLFCWEAKLICTGHHRPSYRQTHVPIDRTAPVKQLTLALNDGKTFMVRELYIWPLNYEASQLWHDKVLTVGK